MRQPLEVAKVVNALLQNADLKRATFYGSPTFTIKATRTQRPSARQQSETFVLTIGRPNYHEKWFIKDALAVGERFPIRKVQLTSFPKKRRV